MPPKQLKSKAVLKAELKDKVTSDHFSLYYRPMALSVCVCVCLSK